MNVGEVMTKDPACCSPETSLQEVARMMVDNDCGCIPIVSDNKAVGTITDRDIATRAVAEGKNPLDLTASDIMTSDVVSVGLNASLDECCKVMEDHQIRRVLVIDDQGCCCGIVAQADVAANASARNTAEVVQEVSKGAVAP